MGRRDMVFTGATADSSADSNRVKVLDHVTKFIFIKNDHATNGIQYQIITYADGRDLTDSDHTLLTWRSLEAGASTIHKTMDPWDEIMVQIKNFSAGNNASAKIWINCGGYRRG